MGPVPQVPFLGAVRPLTIGRRVVYYKRALARAGLYPWLHAFTPVAGPTFVLGVIKLQRANKLKPNAILGEHTHELLCSTKASAPHQGEWAFGAAEIAGMLALQTAITIQQKLTLYWQWWDWFVHHAGPIHYNQLRPQPDLVAKRKPPRLPAEFDCSDTAGEYIPWAAGCKPFDPVYGASGFGNTDSLRKGGTAIEIAQFALWSRDHIVLAFYGPSWDHTDHVVAVRKLDQVYSNGSEAAPEIWDSLYHDRGLNFLGLKAYTVV